MHFIFGIDENVSVYYLTLKQFRTWHCWWQGTTFLGEVIGYQQTVVCVCVFFVMYEVSFICSLF